MHCGNGLVLTKPKFNKKIFMVFKFYQFHPIFHIFFLFLFLGFVANKFILHSKRILSIESTGQTGLENGIGRVNNN